MSAARCVETWSWRWALGRPGTTGAIGLLPPHRAHVVVASGIRPVPPPVNGLLTAPRARQCRCMLSALYGEANAAWARAPWALAAVVETSARADGMQPFCTLHSAAPCHARRRPRGSRANDPHCAWGSAARRALRAVRCAPCTMRTRL